MDTTSGLKTALEPPRFSVTHRFDLSGHVVVVTGGAGLLGRQHAEAIAEAGGVPVIADVRGDAARGLAEEIAYATGGTVPRRFATVVVSTRWKRLPSTRITRRCAAVRARRPGRRLASRAAGGRRTRVVTCRTRRAPTMRGGHAAAVPLNCWKPDGPWVWTLPPAWVWSPAANTGTPTIRIAASPVIAEAAVRTATGLRRRPARRRSCGIGRCCELDTFRRAPRATWSRPFVGTSGPWAHGRDLPSAGVPET